MEQVKFHLLAIQDLVCAHSLQLDVVWRNWQECILFQACIFKVEQFCYWKQIAVFIFYFLIEMRKWSEFWLNHILDFFIFPLSLFWCRQAPWYACIKITANFTALLRFLTVLKTCLPALSECGHANPSSISNYGMLGEPHVIWRFLCARVTWSCCTLFCSFVVCMEACKIWFFEAVLQGLAELVEEGAPDLTHVGQYFSFTCMEQS